MHCVYICNSPLPHAICCGLVTCCIYQDDRDQNVKSGWVALSLSHRCRHCNHQLQQSSTITIIIINNTINNCKNHCRLCQCYPSSSSLWRRSSSSSSTPPTAPACVSHCKLVSLLARARVTSKERVKPVLALLAAHPAKVSAGQTAPRPNSYFKLSVHPGYLGWEPVSSKL